MFLGSLGRENEQRLVKHIKKLADCGFAPSRSDVRRLAFEFAEKLEIPHKFNRESGKAGYGWLKSFLERNPDLSVRQSEGLSLARAQGMNRVDVAAFFALLERTLTENDLLNKPSKIFNMDESGLKLNNEPGEVITRKGSKDVHILTAKERGENVTVIGCCSADGKYIPPVLIFKGVYKKPEFSDGLPPGSDVYMNKKSSYISTELFLQWLKTQFIPHKPLGKVMLILDGHSTHCKSIEVLETAIENDIILLCLPSHCTQALQPLDRSFFGPLKAYYRQEATSWMRNHPNRNITRLQAGQLIGKAWQKAATVGTAVSGFEACGIYPLNEHRIPDHFYSISDEAANEELLSNTSRNTNLSNKTLCDKESPDAREQATTSSTVTLGNFGQTQKVNETSPQPSTSKTVHFENPQRSNEVTPSASPIASYTDTPNETTSLREISTNLDQNLSDITPSKFLLEISPVPKIPRPIIKRKKQSAQVLTSVENIQTKKAAEEQKAKKLIKSTKRKAKDKIANRSVSKKISKEDWLSSDEEPLASKINVTEQETVCVECFEEYSKTTKSVDWIKCTVCQLWLHETCSLYQNVCNICGRKKK